MLRTRLIQPIQHCKSSKVAARQNRCQSSTDWRWWNTVNWSAEALKWWRAGNPILHHSTRFWCQACAKRKEAQSADTAPIYEKTLILIPLLRHLEASSVQ